MLLQENKNLKGSVQIITLITIIITVLTGGISYYGIDHYKNLQQEKQKKEQLSKELERKQQEKEKLKDTELETLKEEIEILKNKPSQVIVKEKTTVQEKIIVEKPVNIEKETGNDEINLPEIISSWRKGIGLIICHWDYSEVISSGSTWVQALRSKNSDGSLGEWFSAIHTNKHVVSYEKSRPNRCEIKFPDSNITYKVGEDDYIGRIDNYDYAMLIPNNSDSGLDERRIKKYCKENIAKIGDKVLILGYPTIGSKTDITVTDGIISGFDGDYLITSAKIESGNSGGAAILVKDDCFVGMPTYSTLGEVESLGRILNAWSVK